MLAQPFLRGGDDLVQLRPDSVRADEPAFEACLRLDLEFYAAEPRLQEAFEIDRCVRMGGNDVVGDSDRYLGYSVLPPSSSAHSDRLYWHPNYLQRSVMVEVVVQAAMLAFQTACRSAGGIHHDHTAPSTEAGRDLTLQELQTDAPLIEEHACGRPRRSLNCPPRRRGVIMAARLGRPAYAAWSGSEQAGVHTAGPR